MFPKKRLDGMWTSEIINEQTKYFNANIYAHKLSNGIVFAEIYTMDRKADTGILLKPLIPYLGVLENLAIHSSKE